MDAKTLAAVKQFVAAVGRVYRLHKALVFGSRARGDYLKHSDVDLLLVSDDFADVPFPDRPSRLYQYWTGGLPLEVLCYTRAEFEKKSQMIGLVQDAVKEGISLLE